MTNKQNIIPDITFVIPIYNAEKYLSECLDSLINQNVTKEILCINDGSIDNSLNILKEYAGKYSEIRIIDKKNEGVSKARNLGIDKAKGRYLWFVDADDCVLVENLAEIINLADVHYSDLVRGIVCQQNKEGNVFSLCSASEKVSEQYIKNEKYAEMMSNVQYLLGKVNQGFTPMIWSGFYRKAFLIENQCYFPELPINNAEDEFFEMAVFSNTLKFNLLEVSIPFYFYRYNDSGSSKSLVEQFRGSVTVFPLILEMCENLEEKARQLNQQDHYLEIKKLLWVVRLIALRLNFTAYADIYLSLDNKQKENIKHLINKEHFYYLEEFKYIILSCDKENYYSVRFNLISERLFKLKELFKI